MPSEEPRLADNSSEATSDDQSAAPNVRELSKGDWLHLTFRVFSVVTFVSIAIFAVISLASGHDIASAPTHTKTIVANAFFLTLIIGVAALAIWGAWDTWQDVRHRRVAFAELRANALPARAAQAASALATAVSLVEELKRELDLRVAVLEETKRRVAETTQQVHDMETRAQVDAEETAALNRQYDELLVKRLGHLEHGARRREWLLATVIAAIVGVIAILLAHYTFGF